LVAARAIAWRRGDCRGDGDARLRHGAGTPDQPGQKINVAAIGAGGQGSSNVSALTGENIVAYADVDLGRVSRSLRDKDGVVRPERVALNAAYEKAQHFVDYREMLDKRKDIDAVVIATPDHHHALAACMAMERGLHVFVQKPLTYSVNEARQLLKLARANAEAGDADGQPRALG